MASRILKAKILQDGEPIEQLIIKTTKAVKQNLFTKKNPNIKMEEWRFIRDQIDIQWEKLSEKYKEIIESSTICINWKYM